MAFTVTIDGTPHTVDIVRRRPHLTLRINGREHEITAGADGGDGRHVLTVGGAIVAFARAQVGDRQVVRLDGRNFDARLFDARAAADAGPGGHDRIRAPMPGAVVSVHKLPGDAVSKGDVVITIESMKLQTALPAMRDGVIAEILRQEGETFEKDEIIVRLEAEVEEG